MTDIDRLYGPGVEWYTLNLNPQPWAIGPLSMGRKGTGFFPKIGPNTQLTVYQNAVREALRSQSAKLITGEVELKFYFSRALESSVRSSGKTTRANTADATNLQKATEDALQGILIENDRMVVAVSSVIFNQGPEARSFVIIRISRPMDHESEVPESIWQKVLEEPETSTQSNNWVPPSEDDF